MAKERDRKDYFVGTGDDVYFPLCNTCKHFINNTLTCKAFPERIPNDILDGKANHKKPFEGDHGIQYEPIAEPK